MAFSNGGNSGITDWMLQRLFVDGSGLVLALFVLQIIFLIICLLGTCWFLVTRTLPELKESQSWSSSALEDVVLPLLLLVVLAASLVGYVFALRSAEPLPPDESAHYEHSDEAQQTGSAEGALTGSGPD